MRYAYRVNTQIAYEQCLCTITKLCITTNQVTNCHKVNAKQFYVCVYELDKMAA